MTELMPRDFESAMASLVAPRCCGIALESNWPQTQCQSSRLAEQVGRLDRTAAKSAAALRTKEGTW